MNFDDDCSKQSFSPTVQLLSQWALKSEKNCNVREAPKNVDFQPLCDVSVQVFY